MFNTTIKKKRNSLTKICKYIYNFYNQNKFIQKIKNKRIMCEK